MREDAGDAGGGVYSQCTGRQGQPAAQGAGLRHGQAAAANLQRAPAGYVEAAYDGVDAAANHDGGAGRRDEHVVARTGQCAKPPVECAAPTEAVTEAGPVTQPCEQDVHARCAVAWVGTAQAAHRGESGGSHPAARGHYAEAAGARHTTERQRAAVVHAAGDGQYIGVADGGAVELRGQRARCAQHQVAGDRQGAGGVAGGNSGGQGAVIGERGAAQVERAAAIDKPAGQRIGKVVAIGAERRAAGNVEGSAVGRETAQLQGAGIDVERSGIGERRIDADTCRIVVGEGAGVVHHAAAEGENRCRIDGGDIDATARQVIERGGVQFQPATAQWHIDAAGVVPDLAVQNTHHRRGNINDAAGVQRAGAAEGATRPIKGSVERECTAAIDRTTRESKRIQGNGIGDSERSAADPEQARARKGGAGVESEEPAVHAECCASVDGDVAAGRHAGSGDIERGACILHPDPANGPGKRTRT